VPVGTVPVPHRIILDVDFREEHRAGDPGLVTITARLDDSALPIAEYYHPTFSASHILISD
jgi:hypothetical protein